MNLIAIKDGVVVNAIAVTQADKYASRQFLESKGFTVVENAAAGIGDTYDGNSFAKPAKAALRAMLTHVQFLKRLTAKEIKDLRQTAKNNADVDMFMYKFERAQGVNLDDPDTIAGVNLLASANVIAASRVAEILA